MPSRNDRKLNGLESVLNSLAGGGTKVKGDDANYQTGDCENIPRLLPQIIHLY